MTLPSKSSRGEKNVTFTIPFKAWPIENDERKTELARNDEVGDLFLLKMLIYNPGNRNCAARQRALQIILDLAGK